MNNELEVLTNLIKLDNYIMKDNITIEDVLKEVSFNEISYNNALIIYNGDIEETKKIVNSNITNSILFPNNSYLGINKYLVSKRRDLILSTEKNDIEYQEKQDEFDYIIVLNDELLFKNVKKYYKEVMLIEM